MAATAHIALGSNVGDREGTLREALRLLDARAGGGDGDGEGEGKKISVVRVSSFIETQPVGGPAGQGPYLNAAAEVQTSLSPRELLTALLEVEATLGRDRTREQRWGPRTCDLDILLMGDCVIDEPGLTVPHPRMCERAFVLEPLAEIAPNAVHPVLNVSISHLLAALAAQ